MKLLVVGSGGREHALAWKLTESPRVQKVFVAPGNGGTATETGVENAPIVETPALIEFCRRESISLTVVGPEAPLASGILDAFRRAGLRIFGPTGAGAQPRGTRAPAPAHNPSARTAGGGARPTAFEGGGGGRAPMSRARRAPMS